MKNMEIMELFFKVAGMRKQMMYGENGTPLPHIGQYRCMFRLERIGECTQKELASALAIRPSSLGELLVKLEKKGYVMRRQSEQDKRSLIVSLTDAGIAEVEKYHKEQEKFYGDILSEVSEKEKEIFFQILLKIQAQYKEKENRRKKKNECKGRYDRKEADAYIY